MKSTPRTRMGTRLQHMSYADFHHDITRDPDEVIPKHPVGSQLLERDKEDELVRYMSNLPSYLEKGKDFQEKALNVGVLDWRLLEKWRYNQKQTAQNQDGVSPSSSNSSLFSTDGSSTRSSVGQSYSPVQQRTHHLSVQAPQGALPKDESIQDVKSFSSRGHSCSPSRQGTDTALRQSHPLNGIDGLRGNSGKFQDSVFSMHNPLYRQQKVCGTLPLCKKNESVSKGQQPIVEKYEVVEPWKGKTKIEVCDSTKKTLKLDVTKMESVFDRDQREKSGVLIMPSSEASSTFKVNYKLSSKIEKKFCGRSSFESSLPYKVAANEHSDPTRAPQYHEHIKTSSHASRISHYSTNSKMFDGPSRISAQGVKVPSQPPPTLLPLSARMLSSPSRSRNAGEKKPFAGVRSANIGKLSEDLNVRKSSCSVPRARNPSPIRRLGSAMGKMIKNTGSRDNSPVCRPSSKDCVAKSNSEGSACSIDTSRDKSCSNHNNNININNSRGRSSPLRRLFEPLLKSRGSNSPEPSKKQSSVMVGAIKSCDDQLNIFAGHSLKAKSRPSSDSHHVSKNGSLSLQALLQVSFKNGFPLFTFAIDNESDILAATVRKSFVPGKGHHYWTYTFFNVHEIKRKSGIWLNHVGKGNDHGYVPNVVAQMKVSDSLYSFHKNDDANDHFTREFNLFAVDLGHGDHSATDFHPTNELAAIVTKLARFSDEDSSKNSESSYSWLDLSQSNLQANSDSQNQHYSGDVHVSTMVIRPGGVHTVPSKGEMSTLAQRWRSGGSCDCGGWDLGCQLQVYTNQRECERKIGSSSSCSSDNKFRLFSLVGQDKQLMMGLSPFKERIYSVEFNPSLSLLQAFAICISFLDSKRPIELSEASHIAEKINNEVDVFNIPTRTKPSDHQVGAPTRYVVSYPPHSPVGRV